MLKPGGARSAWATSRRRVNSCSAPIEMLNKLPSQFNSNVHLWSAGDYKAAFRERGFELLNHEDAAGPVSDALEDGLDEIRGDSFLATWKATKGYRGRVGFLSVMAKMLRRRWLHYDLFRARAKG